jgi:hypothetical protein
MNMKFYRLLLGALTVWRITHFFQAEDGPWDVVIKLRLWVGVGFWAKLLDCFHCLSLWIAAPIAWLLGKSFAERAFLWPSLSAAAIILERITNPAPSVRQALYVEDPEGEQKNGLLRPEKTGDQCSGNAASAAGESGEGGGRDATAT